MSPYVQLPGCLLAWDRLKECHNDSGVDGNPLSMRLLGVSGVGKSFLLQTYRDAHPRRHGDEVTTVPLLYLSIPSAPNKKSIYRAFLEGLGTHSGALTTDRMQWQVRQLCRECAVEMVLIDEVHHFIDRGAAHSYASAADALKEMIDLLRLPVVFAGAPRSSILFDHNSQLRSRVMSSHYLKPFDIETQLDALMGFIYALASELPEEQREWLASAEVASRIFYATDGVHRIVATLLKLSAKLSERSGHIDYSSVAELYRTRFWSPPEPKLNPFHADFPLRRLNKPSEPFQPTYLDGDNHAEEIHVATQRRR